jgi:hypothetical protein
MENPGFRKNPASTGQIFMKFDIRVVFEKLSKKFKFSVVMFQWGISAVCSEMQTDYTNTVCGQNVEFLGVLAKFRKAKISFPMPVRSPAWKNPASGKTRLPQARFS